MYFSGGVQKCNSVFIGVSMCVILLKIKHIILLIIIFVIKKFVFDKYSRKQWAIFN